MELMNPEQILLEELSELIEQSRRAIVAQANSGVVLTFWQIGSRINNNILHNKRADYGKQIVVTVSRQLSKKYGRNFEEKNLRRMLQFAEQFDEEIVVTLSRHLSWSHFLVLIPLKSADAKLYYAYEASERLLGVRGLRELVSRKAFERREIANAQLTANALVPFNAFKAPYLLDELGLTDDYMSRFLRSVRLALHPAQAINLDIS